MLTVFLICKNLYVYNDIILKKSKRKKICFPLTYLKIGFEAACNFKVVKFISKDKVNSEVNEYIFIACLKFNSLAFCKYF